MHAGREEQRVLGFREGRISGIIFRERTRANFNQGKRREQDTSCE